MREQWAKQLNAELIQWGNWTGLYKKLSMMQHAQITIWTMGKWCNGELSRGNVRGHYSSRAKWHPNSDINPLSISGLQAKKSTEETVIKHAWRRSSRGQSTSAKGGDGKGNRKGNRGQNGKGQQRAKSQGMTGVGTKDCISIMQARSPYPPIQGDTLEILRKSVGRRRHTFFLYI
jgi:hypothetical protein